MTMGHGPGLWIHSDIVSIRDLSGDQVCILQVDGCQKYGGVNAVGGLIAAAPDLLVALRELSHFVDHPGERTIPAPEYAAMRDRARAAIARAEGNP